MEQRCQRLGQRPRTGGLFQQAEVADEAASQVIDRPVAEGADMLVVAAAEHVPLIPHIGELATGLAIPDGFDHRSFQPSRARGFAT